MGSGKHPGWVSRLKIHGDIHNQSPITNPLCFLLLARQGSLHSCEFNLGFLRSTPRALPPLSLVFSRISPAPHKAPQRGKHLPFNVKWWRNAHHLREKPVTRPLLPLLPGRRHQSTTGTHLCLRAKCAFWRWGFLPEEALSRGRGGCTCRTMGTLIDEGKFGTSIQLSPASSRGSRRSG
jgi:hypothetical protein